MNTSVQAASFTWAYGCVLIMALMPMVCAAIAKKGKFGQSRQDGGFDNHDPRAWMSRQSGWRARANAAQANTFEALPFFIGAVIIAHLLGAHQTALNGLALFFVALRIAYVALYVYDKPTLRSAVWAAGLLVNIAILFIGAR